MELTSYKDFIFVEYGNLAYPDNSKIRAEIKEVTATFNVSKSNVKIPDNMKYSLHTEFSYGTKKTIWDKLPKDNSRFHELYNNGKYVNIYETSFWVPFLWSSEKWAEEFAEFIIWLSEEHTKPSLIEIHPPFRKNNTTDSKNWLCDFDQFFDRFAIFEKIIHEQFPETEIVIENRAGSAFRNEYEFLVYRADDIAELCKRIKNEGIKLGFVLDFPQLVSSEMNFSDLFDRSRYAKAIKLINPYKDVIKGIHVYGKKPYNGKLKAHCGDFDTWFNNSEDKKLFIDGIDNICGDGKRRYFVPEVNNQPNLYDPDDEKRKEYLQNMLTDLFGKEIFN